MYERISTSVNKNKEDIVKVNAKLTASVDHAVGATEGFQLKNAELQEVVTDLQCRSMKCNLVFTGLQENRGEDTEALIRQFICNELWIDDVHEFGNVHRFGKRRGNKPRPIVARFLCQRQHDDVLRHAFRLKGKVFGLHEQFPPIIEEARMKLYPVAKAKRRNGHKVRLVRDKMFVDGVLYTGDTSSQRMESRVQPAAPMNVEESRSKRSRQPSTPNGTGSSTSGCPPSRRARYARFSCGL
ncbi:uncharacterized protein LOC110461149 [Mizuhopecten yessoensis]|uniref:uncharacterized protein LOC110461149 n=1 Tax=Mizuhopecten yessoensis TaxID=6573 RepID=UPI000B45AA34|nr:uncharacterized protein LOC110461149 [Mizuhopecten yessoensis]